MEGGASSDIELVFEQVHAQLLQFEGRQDNDGFNVNRGDMFAFTGFLE
ncbi:hypothetical protein [Trinickia sp. EG282A]